jgi:NADPH-dependent ferric siderophore reductase
MNVLKKKAIGYLERIMAKTGRVEQVSTWVTAGITEITVHMPGVNPEGWKQVQHTKVKVAEGIYRDYSPALWDRASETCKLIVDTSHAGTGSDWAKNLAAGDPVLYVGIGPTGHKPAPRSFCIGDKSSLAHFLELERMSPAGHFSGIIQLNDADCEELFTHHFQTKLRPIRQDEDLNRHLESCIASGALSDQTVFIAGHIPVMSAARKWLRQQEGVTGSIKLLGFWP